MPTPVDVKLFFNFRSPYCYLASKTLFQIFDDYHANLLWRPVGGWDLRSPPDRAKVKVPLTRQDVARFARRMGIPLNPPPLETEPTLAGAGSLYAQQQGLLRPYLVAVMAAEWSEGRNIGERETLLQVAESVGLDRGEFAEAMDNPDNLQQLKTHAEEANQLGVIGVPTFVIDDQIFWGQDRIEFVLEHLNELRLKRDRY
jgi:2-hydroxychromene-2-carboxylate isomerase